MRGCASISSVAAALFASAAACGGGSASVTAELVASGINRPVFATHAPGDATRLFVVEKAGVIRILDLVTGVVRPTPFLDIDDLVGGGDSTSSERGLLGLAFHPLYERNGRFFVNYTNNAGDTVVAAYTRLTADLADAGSGDTILFVDQPFHNHNGGWIGFGPDGFLRVSTGDGGGTCDPDERAQDVTDERLGKILRIDVDGDDFPADPDRDYAIPADNPFVGTNGDDEIWAYGLRQPWRPSFDRATGDFYIADVGQAVREEIDFQPAASGGGENYGWDCMEGTSCAGVSTCPDGACTCGGPELTLPIHSYIHTEGRCSVTGGYVYRGASLPSLIGAYVFADYCTARVWSLRHDGGAVTELREWTAALNAAPGVSIESITSFGEDATGELYICDQGPAAGTGEIFRIIPVTCAADLDGSGDVGFADLLQVLSSWGPCTGCPEDLDVSGDVGFGDLLIVLSTWGAC